MRERFVETTQKTLARKSYVSLCTRNLAQALEVVKLGVGALITKRGLVV